MKARFARKPHKAAYSDRNVPEGSIENKCREKIKITDSLTKPLLQAHNSCNGCMIPLILLSLVILGTFFWLNGSYHTLYQQTSNKEHSSRFNQTRLHNFIEKGSLKHSAPLYIKDSEKTPPTSHNSQYHNINLLHDSSGIISKAYENSELFLQGVISSHEPTLIKNTPLQQYSIFNYDFSTFLQASAKSNGRTTQLSSIALPGASYLQKDSVFVARNDRDENGLIDEELLYTYHCQKYTSMSNESSSTYETDYSDRRCKKCESPEYVNTTLSDFIYETFTLDRYLYWVGELSFFENQLLAMHTNSTSTSTAANKNKNKFRKIKWKLFQLKEKEYSSTSTPLIWLSHPGVVTQTHYDTRYNFIIQLQGYTRYLLFAPDTELYSYPSIHAAQSQSQIHLEEAPFTAAIDTCTPYVVNSSIGLSTHTYTSELRYPFYSTDALMTYNEAHKQQTSIDERNLTKPLQPINGLVVYLKPGDVLYIPPYWAHRAESESLTVALSVSSRSHIETAFAEIYKQKVPFGSFTATRQHRMIAVVTLYKQLMSALYEDSMIAGGETGVSDGISRRIPILQVSVFDGATHLSDITDACYSQENANESVDRCAQSFASELYHTRYSLLYSTTALQASELYTDMSASLKAESPQQQQQQLRHDDSMSHICKQYLRGNNSEIESLLVSNYKNFQVAVKTITSLLNSISIQKVSGSYDQTASDHKHERYTSSMKKRFLQDYFEQISRWAVGADNVALFINSCLSSRDIYH